MLNFVAPCHSEIQHIRIVRDGSPNQFMVLLELVKEFISRHLLYSLNALLFIAPRFRANAAALEFYQTYNGAAYNTLEPDSLCHAVWVSEIERGDDGVPPAGHTELPTCPG